MTAQEKDLESMLKTYPARIARKKATALRRYAEGDKIMEEVRRMEADYENLKKQAQ